MAVEGEDSVVEKLTCFRRILHDTATDNNTDANCYNEHDISVIRDLTLCMQVAENRHVYYPVHAYF